MQTIHKMLLMLDRGSIGYYLRDQFTTDAAISNGNALPAEPGPGTLTYAEVDGTIAKSGGRLTFTAQATPAYGDLGWRETAGRARVAGRALGCKFSINAVTGSVNMIFAGWGFDRHPNTSSDVRYGLNHFNANLVLASGSSGFVTLEASALAASTEYTLALVLRTIGCDYWIKGGGYTDWTRVWRDYENNDATLWPCGAANNVAGYWDDVSVFDTSPASLDIDTAPTTGADYTAPATGFYDLFVTLNGSPAADEVGAELQFRKQDANNYMFMQIKRNAGNTAWDAIFNVVTAGTPGAAVTVTAVGTPQVMSVRVRAGNLIQMFTRAASAWSVRGAEQTNASFAAATTISPVFTGAVATRIVATKRTDAGVSAALNAFLP